MKPSRHWLAMITTAIIWICIGLVHCTTQQRTIVKTMIDIVEVICGESDSPMQCIDKMKASESLKEKAKLATSTDASAGVASTAVISKPHMSVAVPSNSNPAPKASQK